MKKQIKGDKKQKMVKAAKGRFVTKSEKSARKKRWQIKLVENANRKRNQSEAFSQVVQEYNEALKEAQVQSELEVENNNTEDALLNDKEPDID